MSYEKEMHLPEGIDLTNPVMAEFNHRSKWQPFWFKQPIDKHMFKGKIILVAAWKVYGRSVWVTFMDGEEQGELFSANLKALNIVQGDYEDLPVWGCMSH